MIKSSLLYALILVWFPLVRAQYGGSTDTTRSTVSSTTSASPSGATQTVDAGKHGLSFEPDTLNVAPGGQVEFHFFPGNHSVARASFDNPCHPMSDTSFFSGFMPSTNGESVSP